LLIVVEQHARIPPKSGSAANHSCEQSQQSKNSQGRRTPSLRGFYSGVEVTRGVTPSVRLLRCAAATGAFADTAAGTDITGARSACHAGTAIATAGLGGTTAACAVERATCALGGHGEGRKQDPGQGKQAAGEGQREESRRHRNFPIRMKSLMSGAHDAQL